MIRRLLVSALCGAIALAVFSTGAVRAAPGAADSASYSDVIDAAFDRQASGDTAGAQRALDALPVPTARRVAAVMTDVDQALEFPLTDTVPSGIAPGSVIVVLGFGLLPDGRMRPTLTQRLSQGLAVAHAYQVMPVVVSGGNPRAGRTEAAAMRDWLVAHGLRPTRIHLEDASTSTATNALNTAALISRRALGSGVVLVTSANHLRRSVADFLCAGVTLQAVIAADGSRPVPDSDEVRAMFADARAVAGI